MNINYCNKKLIKYIKEYKNIMKHKLKINRIIIKIIIMQWAQTNNTIN